MRLKSLRKVSPVSLVATALIVGGTFAIIGPSLPGGETGADPGDCVLNAAGECVPGLPSGSLRLYPTSPGPVLAADEACRDVAYLCADLETQARIVIRRWRDFSGTIVVHIPVPRMADETTARRLQRAASAGVRLWNGYPFPILVDDRGNRQAHFAVQWQQGVTGNQIGLARTSWHPASGLRVHSLQLAVRNPFVPSQTISDRQVRLTAMHEMGHALGLPHSDSPRDVMYPTSTATALSARDYVAMEALYAFEDGTEIVR